MNLAASETTDVPKVHIPVASVKVIGIWQKGGFRLICFALGTEL